VLFAFTAQWGYTGAWIALALGVVVWVLLICGRKLEREGEEKRTK
jgi:hypothetical protein